LRQDEAAKLLVDNHQQQQQQQQPSLDIGGGANIAVRNGVLIQVWAVAAQGDPQRHGTDMQTTKTQEEENE